jgi:ABC-type branched-subunit amino acid transport system substrate-binding protein
MQNSWRFRNYLMADMPVDESGNPLQFEEFDLTDDLAQIWNLLSKEEENLLVVFSDSEPEVNSLVTRLIQRISLYPVILFGMPSWQSWTNIDLTFFHNLQLHLVTPFYTDFSSPRVKNFLSKSRGHYGYEPYEKSPSGYNFSMLGYDIGFYFMSALKQFGKNFSPCIDQVQAEQLLTRYHFVKTGTGGYVNNSYNLIRYRNDFTVEKTGIINGEPLSPVVTPTAPEPVPPGFPGMR